MIEPAIFQGFAKEMNKQLSEGGQRSGEQDTKPQKVRPGDRIRYAGTGPKKEESRETY